MATHKHKFKVGDKVVVIGKTGKAGVKTETPGSIYTIGYATNGTRNFTVCDTKKEIEDTNPLGYQVIMGRRIMIVKECDILPA